MSWTVTFIITRNDFSSKSSDGSDYDEDMNYDGNTIITCFVPQVK